MKRTRMLSLVIMSILNILLLAGCWNYREVDQLSIVAGVAIDKGIHEKYSLSVEIAEISGEKESETKSKTITVEGKTIFDAARNAISFMGKKLYWSHAKVVIVSREVAETGLVDILDWYNRDAETRGDIHILVSKGESAKEILSRKSTTEKVKSFEIDKMMENQKALSKTSPIEIWEITNELAAKGVGAISAAVDLEKSDGEEVPRVLGTAVFKGNKLIGFLDADETKALLFIRNKLDGGILAEDIQMNGIVESVSLEIFKSKTKVQPVVSNEEIKMKVSVETTVAIDEIEGTFNVIEDEGRKKLEKFAEESLKSQMENLIKKVQLEYGVDIFGFGTKLREEKPKAWESVSSEWANVFKDIKVDVNVKVHVKNSAMLSKPLEVGD
ncbi:MAG: Ger(x)C family spore germination protein [Clostridia bacterium]|nr:Ger(x)C family spore germination protein [Clostridia bacterium]